MLYFALYFDDILFGIKPIEVSCVAHFRAGIMLRLGWTAAEGYARDIAVKRRLHRTSTHSLMITHGSLHLVSS